ncbi:AAA family ATPase [Phaeobacter italicus]|uniref:AAA family ATPase n=1 Tax=Phaeobacter italicus TaxID=481446 RepID=UPI000669E2F6|nr:ATP-binding protein [Phaeobacter italicus]CRL15228.1 putative ATPase [Phaeobacter italicus]SFH68486.1 hypothetical protein SAMN04488019_1315 [Phaeobacter italicus]
MLIDFTVRNFRSFEDEVLFSMNVENSRSRLRDNHHEIENGKYAVLKSAAIFGPNASGKSNLLKAIRTLSWMVCNSNDLQEGEAISPYEPFRLSEDTKYAPTEFEVEFVVPSGMRYRYELAFDKERITSETLFSFPGRQRALIFERKEYDTWETIKFGGTYKGGSRRLSFFKNNCYLARAGNDAAAPESIREIIHYFRSINFIGAGTKLRIANYFAQDGHLEAVGEIIRLADTGVQKVTSEKRKNPEDIRLPDDMPEELKAAIIEENSKTYKFWLQAKSGELVSFDERDMSDGTVKLFEILPMLLNSLSNGAPILFDELDGHLHTHLVALVLQLFHDPVVNKLGAQIIFTTHDTNIMKPSVLRRDQIWITHKKNGGTYLSSLDEYNKNVVRPDSPFEDFYLDGRLGALPSIPYSRVREALSRAVGNPGYFVGDDSIA